MHVAFVILTVFQFTNLGVFFVQLLANCLRRHKITTWFCHILNCSSGSIIRPSDIVTLRIDIFQ